MANNKRKLNGGWLAVLLLVVLLGILIVLAYLLSVKVNKLKDVEKTILMFNFKEKNFDSLQDSVANFGEEKKIVEDYFVTDETLTIFIEQLEGLASSANVALEITNAAMTSGANPVMRLDFTAEASFPRLFQFASLVDSLPYALDLTQASFFQNNGEEKEKEKGSWKGVFGLNLVTSTSTSAT